MNPEELSILLSEAKECVAKIAAKIKLLDGDALADEIEEIKDDLDELVQFVDDTLDGYSNE